MCVMWGSFPLQLTSGWGPEAEGRRNMYPGTYLGYGSSRVGSPNYWLQAPEQTKLALAMELPSENSQPPVRLYQLILFY